MFLGKQNQLNSFSRMIKKLEIDKVSIPDLRSLKEGHMYLEKLKQQRLKIEELKHKYQQSEIQIKQINAQNRDTNGRIKNHQNTIEFLQNELEKEVQKRKQCQQSINKHWQKQREHYIHQLNELAHENESLKKTLKQRDITMYELEDKYYEKIKQLKQQYIQQRKKIIRQCQEKIKNQSISNFASEQEIDEMKKLIFRQNNTLKILNQQYEELKMHFDTISEENEKIRSQYTKIDEQRLSYETTIQQLQDGIEYLKNCMSQQMNNIENRDQLQEMRKKMNQLTKDEIQKIQFIVNDLQ